MPRITMFILSVIDFFFKQKTAYEMRISDWSSDVCSSDLDGDAARAAHHRMRQPQIVIAAELAEIGARPRAMDRPPPPIAPRILDRDDSGNPGQLAHRPGATVGHGARGHVLDTHRQVARLAQRPKSPDQPPLPRPVVTGGDDP